MNLKAALQDVSFREILIFDSVVRSGSMSAAARHLHLNAPLVTKVLQRLENNLGFALFTRSHRGAVLTAEGQSFLTLCHELIHTLETSDINEVPPNAKQMPLLRCVAPMYLATHLVAPAATPRLLQLNMNLSLMHLDQSLMTELAPKNLFDVAVHNEPIQWSRAWRTCPLGAVDWVLCARLDHPLRSHSNEKEVLQFPFIAPLVLSNTEVQAGNDNCPLPIRRRFNRVEVNNNEIGVKVCEASDALIFLPQIQAQPSLRGNRIRVINVKDWPLVRKAVYLSVHQDRVSHSTLKMLTQTLSAAL